MSLLHPDETSAESGHINVIAQIYAKAGKEMEVRQLLMDMARAAREENGCKGYHLLEAAHAPGTFFTYEEWTGEDVLKTHLEGATKKLAGAMDLFAQEPQQPIVFHHML